MRHVFNDCGKRLKTRMVPALIPLLKFQEDLRGSAALENCEQKDPQVAPMVRCHRECYMMSCKGDRVCYCSLCLETGYSMD